MENMKRGLKTFARAVRDGDIDKAEEMLDKIVQGDLKPGVWEGYRKALRGMVEALTSGDELTLPRQIAGDNFSIEKLKDIREEMRGRYSQNFRPEYERGFNKAWSDVLEVITEDAGED